MPGSSTTPSRRSARNYRAPSCCLPQCQRRRRSGQLNYRGSMAGPHVPLSTLRRMSRNILRMTRGQRGLLDLRCKRLALFTPCRSPGAPTILFKISRVPISRPFISVDCSGVDGNINTARASAAGPVRALLSNRIATAVGDLPSLPGWLIDRWTLETATQATAVRTAKEGRMLPIAAWRG